MDEMNKFIRDHYVVLCRSFHVNDLLPHMTGLSRCSREGIIAILNTRGNYAAMQELLIDIQRYRDGGLWLMRGIHDVNEDLYRELHPKLPHDVQGSLPIPPLDHLDVGAAAPEVPAPAAPAAPAAEVPAPAVPAPEVPAPTKVVNFYNQCQIGDNNIMHANSPAEIDDSEADIYIPSDDECEALSDPESEVPNEGSLNVGVTDSSLESNQAVPIDQTHNEPPTETSNEPLDQTTNEPLDQTTNEPLNQLSNDPHDQSSNDDVDDPDQTFIKTVNALPSESLISSRLPVSEAHSESQNVLGNIASQHSLPSTNTEEFHGLAAQPSHAWEQSNDDQSHSGPLIPTVVENAPSISQSEVPQQEVYEEFFANTSGAAYEANVPTNSVVSSLNIRESLPGCSSQSNIQSFGFPESHTSSLKAGKPQDKDEIDGECQSKHVGNGSHESKNLQISPEPCKGINNEGSTGDNDCLKNKVIVGISLFIAIIAVIYLYKKK